MTAPNEPKPGTPTCQGTVWDGWRHFPCSKPAKRDGWCGIHHPEAVAKRQQRVRANSAERLSNFRKQCDAEQEKRRRQSAYPKLVAALKAELESNGPNKPCGHDWHCVCSHDGARLLLKELGELE